jgi:hypothetical protein
LPCNDRRDAHTHRLRYAVEMGSGVMIYIPSFVKIGSDIHKLIWGDTQTHRQDGDRINLL